MTAKVQAIRGMNDILPDQAPYWQYLERGIAKILRRYAYKEVRLPIVEKSELFVRTIGAVTDIVEKEMYTFEDRNGDSLSLRPEGTAGCVRAAIENGLLYNQVHRLWYSGPMFRHERPQKGRYRQFFQIGVEVFGMEGPHIDAELILMSARMWRELGIQGLALQINSLGSLQSRHAYRDSLVHYLSHQQDKLDEDSQRRLHHNPLRILDSKNPAMAEIIAAAPKMIDALDPVSKDHFEQLRAILDQAGVAYTVNPALVRGLDYYGDTVFEWVTQELGAQGAVCAGGRFDLLTEQLGGHATPAAGFAIGMERLVALLVQQGIKVPSNRPLCYLVVAGQQAQHQGLLLAEFLRDKLPAVSIEVDCHGGSFKSQLKKADKSGALVALILGEDEIRKDCVTVKSLRDEKPQQAFTRDQLVDYLEKVY